MEPSVAIVGFGSVGGGLYELFPGAVLYDEPRSLGDRQDVNACRVAFVCVPTPSRDDGSCDTSVVEEVVAWLETEIIAICSTVAVGTTQSLIGKTGKRIVFQPEFSAPGSPNHPFRNRRAVGWLILGGARADTQPVADLFKRVFGADLVIRHTDSRTAELAKYMENSFLATKVGFCNEFFDIARALGVDYDELRDLWLLDPRIGASHTLVFPDDRGFGGKCLPKDLDAIIATALANGCRPELLMSLRQANASLRRTDTPVPLPD